METFLEKNKEFLIPGEENQKSIINQVEQQTFSTGKIVAISISKKKGIPKTNVQSVNLIENFGIEGDIHAGNWHRQVSFLALESIEKMREKVYQILDLVHLQKTLQLNF